MPIYPPTMPSSRPSAAPNTAEQPATPAPKPLNHLVTLRRDLNLIEDVSEEPVPDDVIAAKRDAAFQSNYLGNEAVREVIGLHHSIAQQLRPGMKISAILDVMEARKFR